MKCRLLALLLLICNSCFAWNAVGHRTIAYIAYQHLTPGAKQMIDSITSNRFHSHYADSRLMSASSWPDQLRMNGITQYNHWHFISYPLIRDHQAALPLNQDNLVWAINMCQQQLQNQHLTMQQKAWYLSFLVHLIGDASQPLHCTTLYSKRFPAGDHGGNLYKIHGKLTHNLHSLWDQGFGLLASHGHYVTYWTIKKIAVRISRRYPESYFEQRLIDPRPQDWAQFSYRLGIKHAYSIAYNQTPSRQYIQQGKQIVMQQIAIAGYRVAQILNRIFSQGTLSHDANHHTARS